MEGLLEENFLDQRALVIGMRGNVGDSGVFGNPKSYEVSRVPEGKGKLPNGDCTIARSDVVQFLQELDVARVAGEGMDHCKMAEKIRGLLGSTNGSDTDRDGNVNQSQVNTGRGVESTDVVKPQDLSWRSLFRNAKRHDQDLKLAFHKLSIINDKVVALCPQTIIDDKARLWSNMLVGNFLGRRPSYSYVKSMAMKI